MGLLETPEASYSGNKCTSRLGEPLGTATPAAVATAWTPQARLEGAGAGRGVASSSNNLME